jgi:hypothetical protein
MGSFFVSTGPCIPSITYVLGSIQGCFGSGGGKEANCRLSLDLHVIKEVTRGDVLERNRFTRRAASTDELDRDDPVEENDMSIIDNDSLTSVFIFDGNR